MTEPDAPDAPEPAPDAQPPAVRRYGRALPADPDKYDAPRNVAARSRGLEQAYIVGGEDPNLDETLRRERRYVRLLVAMAVGIVLLGFALGIVGALLSSVVGR